MNVYDFDKTVYAGDSTVDFWLYAIRRQPGVLRHLPAQCAGMVQYLLGRLDKTGMKACFFSFLADIDAPVMVESFWDRYQGRICDWYLKQQQPEDLIISASPLFLLQPICRRLGIERLIASPVDAKTGRFAGPNCRGEQKVQCLTKQYGTEQVNSFYSDSRSDLPMARLAQNAFLVRRGKVTAWPWSKN